MEGRASFYTSTAVMSEKLFSAEIKFTLMLPILPLIAKSCYEVNAQLDSAELKPPSFLSLLPTHKHAHTADTKYPPVHEPIQ